jgi:hypothetical protein
MRQKSYRSVVVMAGLAISVLLGFPGVPGILQSSAMASIVGVDGDVKGSVTDTQKRTEEVFHDLGISQVGSSVENSGAKQTLKGQKGDTEVTVTINRGNSNTSHVEVTANQGALKWNKDYAQNVLTSIVQKG